MSEFPLSFSSRAVAHPKQNKTGLEGEVVIGAPISDLFTIEAVNI